MKVLGCTRDTTAKPRRTMGAGTLAALSKYQAPREK